LKKPILIVIKLKFAIKEVWVAI